MTGTEPYVTTTWWWVRHAPVINPGNRIYGQMDLPADTGDVESFHALADRLPAGAVWLVTPLQRTRQTAAAICAADSAARLAPEAQIVEPALMEQSFGSWQGLSQDEAYAADPVAATQFWRRPAEERPPEGESFTEVMARVAAAVTQRTASNAGCDIVAVSHGGAIRAALAQALSLQPGAALRIVIDTLSVTRIDRLERADGEVAWRVHSVNFQPQS